LRLRSEDVLALHVRRHSSVVPEQGGDVLAVRLCVHWLAVRNAVCGCKRNGQSLGHCLAVAASLRRPVRSAVQTGQFRTATCQNGRLQGGRHPPGRRRPRVIHGEAWFGIAVGWFSLLKSMLRRARSRFAPAPSACSGDDERCSGRGALRGHRRRFARSCCLLLRLRLNATRWI